MMSWNVVVTESFSKTFKKYKKNKEFSAALESKIQRLKENPEAVGGYLAGRLHGYKSTRLVGKFRLIFKVSKPDNNVYLIAIDHRKFNYERFE